MKRTKAWIPSLWDEWFAVVAGVTALVFLVFGKEMTGASTHPAQMALIFVVLFGVILVSALSVVRHADALAERLGEPYGTLILTLSIGLIEVVSITAVILHGDNNPTLVRESLVSVIMIVLNGMVGVSLLIGGWRHREQHYNLQGANTYLGIIIPLVVLSLVLPSYTRTTTGPTLSGIQSDFLILISLGLYGAFLAAQTGRHHEQFVDDVAGHDHALVDHGMGPTAKRSAVLLLCYLIPVVILAEQLAHPIDFLIETLRAPVALGGLALAALVALPEAIGAVKAAFANRLQRALNIFLGSALATIGLTIPAMLMVGHLSGRTIILGVEGTDRVMLLLTLTVCIVTLSSIRTNVLQGAVHLILFATYLLLIFQG